jgi:hypothetical protein
MGNIFSRAAAETALVKALTRQIGYTTGAYSIERMAKLVTLFSDATAYQFELVRLLQTEPLDFSENLSEKYATEILNFACSLGIFYRLPGTSAATHLARYGLTDAGVALRAAAKFQALRPLVLTDLILENDADAYILALHLLSKATADTKNDELAAEFRSCVYGMRAKRLEWLIAAFPNKTLLHRFTDKISWIKRSTRGGLDVEEPKQDFGRHHWGPRKSWAQELGHCSASNQISADGNALLSLFKLHEPATIWLAPSPQVLDYLRIKNSHLLEGPREPVIDLLLPIGSPSSPSPDVVEQVACFLEESFIHIRLHHARQASTAAARYYLHLLEIQRGGRISWEETMRAINAQYASRFSFFSSRQGQLAYYQLRKSNESR